jgi:hypothetical protein
MEPSLTTEPTHNPLSKHFRQPKLFVELPSRGQYYADGAIVIPSNNQFPVLAMTAKDELMFKTPDALLNGQATVSVIQSCFPSIKDAWSVPSIDIDAILIAIRIATYGESMDLDIKIPNTNEERGFSVDLRVMLDTLSASEYNNILEFGAYTFELRPLNYKSYTETAMKTFEEQRIFQTINNQDLDDTQKLEMFTKSFDRLTDINISQLSKTVVSVSYGQEDAVTNPEFIAEFFENTEKEVFKSIIDRIDEEKKKFAVKPQLITTSDEDREKGAPETFEVPITFDQTNFFA